MKIFVRLSIKELAASVGIEGRSGTRNRSESFSPDYEEVFWILRINIEAYLKQIFLIKRASRGSNENGKKRKYTRKTKLESSSDIEEIETTISRKRGRPSRPILKNKKSEVANFSEILRFVRYYILLFF